MRVLICGSREWDDYPVIKTLIAGLRALNPRTLTIIEGEATGADTMARRAAQWLGVGVEKYPAKWDDLAAPGAVVKTRHDGMKYNAMAGPMRNQQMLDEGKPALVFAFHDDLEHSKGTKDMVEKAHAAGVPVYVVRRYQ